MTVAFRTIVEDKQVHSFTDPFIVEISDGSSSATFAVDVRKAYTFKVAAATMKGLGPFSPVLTINPDPADTFASEIEKKKRHQIRPTKAFPLIGCFYERI
ncbi:hypothetical protein NECAME_02120 [Necator americanus]|uniref:Fibronectin type-III domain-containing protein n=1 Tax=Necator americanus TaxID=51031 RepID=W2THA8_NECAM|nr:hypothetical protein NECAME_02120 [Necator americanus]ETN81440.1 hypothetical protein NECAME_02120 [Necator americanus]